MNAHKDRFLASHPCLPQASSAVVLVFLHPSSGHFPLGSNPDYIPPPCSCLKGWGHTHPPNPTLSNTGNTIELLLIECDSMPTCKTLKDSTAQASLQLHSTGDADHRHPGKQQFRGACDVWRWPFLAGRVSPSPHLMDHSLVRAKMELLIFNILEMWFQIPPPSQNSKT